jgi:two-component system, cell cycle response regulator DivK
MTPDRRRADRRQSGQATDTCIGAVPPVDRRRSERRRLSPDGRFRDRRRLPRPQRVLLVDDDPDVRAVWREWLTLWQFYVIEAEDGSVALERAHDRHPDLVLMDVTMPILDGFGATERLKQSPATAHVPVLLLSADTAGAAATRAAIAGGQAFLSKPIRAGQLLEAIRDAFRRVTDERSGSSTEPGDLAAT